MSDAPVYMSRRERREAEARNISSVEVATTPNETSTFAPVAEETRAPEIFLEPVRPADFGSTSNLGAEPISASIIISSVPDLENNQIIISESGGILRTGSIELPKIDPSTGSIAIISAGEEADEAINEDSLNSFVSSVAPLRAAGIAKNRAKTVEVTLVTRKGQGQVYAVMSTAVLMITVGALVVAAFLLDIF